MGMDTELPEIVDDLETNQVINDTVRKKAAALAAGGAAKNKIKTELKLSGYGIKKLFDDEEFKRLVTEIGDDAVAASKNEMKLAIARMTKKAVTALERNLDKHSLEAVKVFMKSIGLGDGAVSEDKNTGFTLVLANQQKPTPHTITVKKEGNDE